VFVGMNEARAICDRLKSPDKQLALSRLATISPREYFLTNNLKFDSNKKKEG